MSEYSAYGKAAKYTTASPSYSHSNYAASSMSSSRTPHYSKPASVVVHNTGGKTYDTYTSSSGNAGKWK